MGHACQTSLEAKSAKDINFLQLSKYSHSLLKIKEHRWIFPCFWSNTLLSNHWIVSWDYANSPSLQKRRCMCYGAILSMKVLSLWAVVELRLTLGLLLRVRTLKYTIKTVCFVHRAESDACRQSSTTVHRSWTLPRKLYTTDTIPSLCLCAFMSVVYYFDIIKLYICDVKWRVLQTVRWIVWDFVWLKPRSYALLWRM